MTKENLVGIMILGTLALPAAVVFVLCWAMNESHKGPRR